MRVNELSRELGRTNKEVLDLLRAQGYEVKSHSSNVSGEQIDAVRRGFAGKPARAEKEPTPVKGMGESEGRAPSREEQDSSRVKSQENRENWEQVQKERIGKAEAARVEEIKREPVKTEADGNGTAEPPKKRITAVYRPQNSTMKSSKPSGGQRQGQGRSQGGNGQGRQGNQNGQGNQGSREAGQGNRDGGRSFNRDGQGGRDGGRSFNRDGQGSRDGGRSFNRDGQGGRDGGRGFNRDGQGGRDGGRSFNRDNQGSRDGQGNRDGGRFLLISVLFHRISSLR